MVKGIQINPQNKSPVQETTRAKDPHKQISDNF